MSTPSDPADDWLDGLDGLLEPQLEPQDGAQDGAQEQSAELPPTQPPPSQPPPSAPPAVPPPTTAAEPWRAAPPPGPVGTVSTGPPPLEAPRRLHAFSMVRGIPLQQLAGSVPALLIVSLQSDAPVIVLLPLLLLVVAAVRAVSWTRHTYELRAGRIVERKGLLSRSERALEIARIQQIDVERTLLDRLVGTCELRLETAADSGDSELSLRVVTVEEADRLRQILAAAAATAGRATAATPSAGSAEGAPAAVGAALPSAPVVEEQLVAVSLPRVALAAITGPRLLAIPAFLGILVGSVLENAPLDDAADAAEDVVGRLGLVGGVVVVLVGLVLSVAVAAVSGILKDGGFEIVQRGTDLVVRRGLTTTRTATVPLRRVQRITIRRTWLHARLGFATVTVHSAGGAGPTQGGPGAAADRSLTVPLMPEADVERLVVRLLDVPELPPMHAHPPAARRRAIVRGALGSLVLTVPLMVVTIAAYRPQLLLVALLFPLAGAAMGLGRYRRMASGATNHAVATRSGLLGTVTLLAPVRKLQGTTVASTWFQRRRELATLAVHIAGPAGGVAMRDVHGATAHGLARALR